MKIVVLDGYTLNPGDLSWERIKMLGDFSVYDRTPPDMTIERAKDAEAVFTNKTVLDAATLAQLPKLRYIGVLATGYNVVDTAAAKAQGIAVTNIPGYSTESVAQLTFALILELCHHAGAHSDSVRRGDWSGSRDFAYWNYPLIELANKTIGIVGFGSIGSAVARIALAFDMNVLAYRRNVDRSIEKASLRFSSIDEIFAQSDVISLHCPLTDSTKGIINRESIARMKKSAMIINTGRGPLVVEEDLAAALNAGQIAGAAVDVLSIEPPKKDNPLLTAKNCIITPHIGWAPFEARTRLMTIAAENLERFLAGTPVNVINP